MTARPIFSLVLPAYNEGENLRRMSERLACVAAEVQESVEIIWVNDGSTDDTEAILDALAAADARNRAIHFSRNFGHMAALTAGLEAARATGAVICLDSDGQHPPELIPTLIERWRAGADIVQTIREESGTEGVVKQITSRQFYRVLNGLADLDLPAGAADFRLLDRQVVDALNELPETVRFMRGLVFWVGFRREYVPYRSQPRMGGTSKYGLPAMIQFALSGITSFSMRPLRLSFLMGMVVAMLAVVYAGYVLWCYATGIPLTPGWTSLLLTVMLLGCAQLFAIGIASEYLGRIFLEQKHRPLYVVRKPRDAHVRDGLAE